MDFLKLTNRLGSALHIIPTAITAVEKIDPAAKKIGDTVNTIIHTGGSALHVVEEFGPIISMLESIFGCGNAVRVSNPANENTSQKTGN